ncbi:MAG: hypothetical protein OEZ20_03010 [candidate division WOR-3 bacterium]|nr:hypothetical protein [candidate division WOR-3 bacterium]
MILLCQDQGKSPGFSMMTPLQLLGASTADPKKRLQHPLTFDSIIT